MTPPPIPTPTATLTAVPSGGGGGTTTNAPPSTTDTSPAPTGSSGGVVVTTSSTSSSSGGVQVVGQAQAGTGVSDIPTNLSLPNTFGTENAALVAPPIDPSVLTKDVPASITANVSSTTGGIIVAGNTAVIVPPAALAAVPGQQATFDIKPAVNVPVPGGPAQFSPNGTQLDIKITDKNGNQVTTFPVPIPIVVKYNAADVGQSNGRPETLTAAYVVDDQTPGIANPNGFPNGTFVIFPSEHVSNNTKTGTLTATTQAIGSVISVVTNPVGYVQTLGDTDEVSSFDPSTSQTFGTKPPQTILQVVEPQIGNSLLVIDPDTGNYGYVDAKAVGPSGPPPDKTQAAVVRGLLEK